MFVEAPVDLGNICAHSSDRGRRNQGHIPRLRASAEAPLIDYKAV